MQRVAGGDVNLDEPRPWSNRNLRRLGEALVDGREPPGGCPPYAEVMLWNNDLAAEVKTTLANNRWSSFTGKLDITARSKTHDTLVEKLRRESHLSLDQVQDLAWLDHVR
jgi:ppGpp synthetase/RelA/SpoT-type nucleotidyltranferase